MKQTVEGLGGLMVINGAGLLIVGLMSLPEAKRAKAAGSAPGFLADWATAFIRFGLIFTPLGLLLLLLAAQ